MTTAPDRSKGPASGSTSRGAWSRHRAAGSGWRVAPGPGRRSRTRCPSVSRTVSDAVPVRERDGFSAAVNAELAEDALDVGGDRLLADHEHVRDRRLILAGGEVLQDL